MQNKKTMLFNLHNSFMVFGQVSSVKSSHNTFASRSYSIFSSLYISLNGYNKIRNQFYLSLPIPREMQIFL